MNCPRCGYEASLTGLPAGVYPAAYRCKANSCGFSFSGRGPEADRDAEQSRAASRANAASLLRRRCVCDDAMFQCGIHGSAKRILELLRRIEWNGAIGTDVRICPACGAVGVWRDDGTLGQCHVETCDLAALLREQM